MITAYVDHYLKLEDQISLYKALNLQQMPLRKIGKESLYVKDDDFLEHLSKTLKAHKITPAYIDIVEHYTLMDLIDVERIFYIAKVLNVNTVLLNLPTLTDFQIEKDLFIQTIETFLNTFKKEKITPVFHVNYEIDSAYIAYLIHTFKDIKFSYNPGLCYYHDKAASMYHRLLANHMTHVLLYDIDENKEIALLGYGEAKIMDTLDRLILEKYKGDVILDTNLLEYIHNRKAIYGTLFKLPFFKHNKSKKAYQQIEDKLGLTKEDDVTFQDIYVSQIALVKRYLK